MNVAGEGEEWAGREGFPLMNIKTYYKAVVSKTVTIADTGT